MTPPLDDDAVRLCRWLAGTVFPWDITRSLELALLKTFCLPSISGLLSRTGEFEQRPRKRYDDTGLGRVCKAVTTLDARRSWCAVVNSPMRSGN